MKKVLSKLMILAIGIKATMYTPILADIRLDQPTRKFYCHNAPSGIDQDEYHELFLRIIALQASKPYQNIDFEIIGMLRIIGTKTALQLIHDLQKIIKESKEDMAKLYS